MKFYEFKVSNGFGYYALIGAETEEKAVEYYKETVADIEDEEISPVEITYYQAKKKFMHTIDNWNEKLKAHEEFIANMVKKEPYLILVDYCLI